MLSDHDSEVDMIMMCDWLLGNIVCVKRIGYTDILIGTETHSCRLFRMGLVLSLFMVNNYKSTKTLCVDLYF